jgi:hypothetical protein
MSQFVHGAEVELLRLVVCMHSSLNDITTSDTLHEQRSTEAEAAAVNSLAIELERFRQTERQRVEVIAGSLRQQADHVRAAIHSLCDLSEDALDAEIRELNHINASMGRRMIQLYDRAAVMAHEIESEVLQETFAVPNR